MRHTAPILYILIILSSPVLACRGGNDSVQTNSCLFEIVARDAVSVLDDGVMIFTAPLRFDETDWLIAAGVAGVTASAFLVDEEVRRFMARRHGEAGDEVMDAARWYGTVQPALIVGGGMYVGGLAFSDPEVRETGLLVLESAAMAGAIVSVLKSAIGRSRPIQDEGPVRFRGLQFRAVTTSLPSGHSAMAFSVSTILAKRIDNPFLSAGLYGLAGLTAISRLYHDDHWFSDVILGSAIGYGVASALASRNRNDNKEVTWSLVPVPDGIGIVVRL